MLPTITIPTSRLLDYLLTYRTDPLGGIHGKRAVIDYETALLISQHDPAEELCHVQLDKERNLGSVWPVKVWRESEEKRQISVARSERSREMKEQLIAARQLMVSNMEADEMLGTLFDRGRLEDLADSIIHKKQYEKAAKWGVPNLAELTSET